MFDNPPENPRRSDRQLNVLGTNLEYCGTDPMTGFYRDGCCNTGPDDTGTHTVCVIVTDEFLKFSKSKGNDLSTPVPQYGFEGLKAGDSWCLVALRWEEARMAGTAPRVKLRATNIKTLEYVNIGDLKAHQIDLS
jgi:uncharacterized protein (DUF2237 family)